MPFSLDTCAGINRVTSDEIVCVAEAPRCDRPVAVSWPDKPIPPAPKSPVRVNGITNAPWPAPPSADPGCNPVAVAVSSTVDPEADITRLEGNVSYLDNDPCLPKLNLNLISAPPAPFGGGFTGSPRGWAISHHGKCARIFNGPAADYRTTADYFANEPGAGVFIPADIDENSPQCPDDCTAIYHYARLAKFNIIGPIMATITGAEVAMYYPMGSDDVPTAWVYTWEPSNCVTAADKCIGCEGAPALGDLLMTFGADANGVLKGYNTMENTNPLGVTMTPGMQLERNKARGALPQPLLVGSQVLMYGYIVAERYAPPVTPQDPEGCSCKITWFCNVGNAFDGDCINPAALQAQVGSMLPTRVIDTAGSFHGVDSNVDRV